MRFARRLVLLLLLSLLAACSPTTPLFVAQVTTGEVAEYKQMKSNRMTAAIEEEGDLLTYSAMAIRDNRSAEAEKLYLTGYDNRRYSAEVRGISLYQIGLIYMSRYNDQRDDAKATDYFQRVVREFPAPTPPSMPRRACWQCASGPGSRCRRALANCSPPGSHSRTSISTRPASTRT